MNLTMDPNFTTTLSKTNSWLKEIEEFMEHEDRKRAYRALKAVLHSLRDRLTVEEVVQLGAQLPLLIRGLYYEGWKPTHKPEKIHTTQKFFENVRKHLGNDIDPAKAVHGVLNLLEKHVSKGEIEDIKSILPNHLLALWD